MVGHVIMLPQVWFLSLFFIVSIEALLSALVLQPTCAVVTMLMLVSHLE